MYTSIQLSYVTKCKYRIDLTDSYCNMGCRVSKGEVENNFMKRHRGELAKIGPHAIKYTNEVIIKYSKLSI